MNNFAEEYLLNVTQGLSEIAYFTTAADIPTAPKVTTVSKTANSITIKWYPQVIERELIEYYYVDIFVQPDSIELLDERNYCEYPREEDIHVETGRVVLPTKHTRNDCALPRRSDDDYLDSDDKPGRSRDINDAELAEQRNQRKLDCLLWHERNTYDRMVTRYLEDQSNNECEPDDQLCESEYNSMRFKRELDNMVRLNDAEPYSEKLAKLFEASLLRKRNVIDTLNHIGNMTFSADRQNGTIENLNPYTLYTMHFFSCNTVTNCSAYYMHNERTKADPEADNVLFKSKVDEDVFNTVHLEFHNPKIPNGLTVAFIIEHRDLSTGLLNETCITMKEHLNRQFRYVCDCYISFLYFSIQFG